MSLSLFSCSENKVIESGNLKIIKKSVKNIEDIESIDSNLVKPVDYINVFSLSKLPIHEKKKKFITFLEK